MSRNLGIRINCAGERGDDIRRVLKPLQTQLPIAVL